MLYRAYREKLEKGRRVFERVWRFRFLILGCFLALLALAATLLGIKGEVYGEIVPSEVVYGDPYAVTAHAIFGEAEIEYRTAGEGEWSAQKPVCAGEYECRAVGQSAVGTPRRGGVFSFRILPARAEVVARDEELVFGDDPTFTAEMRYGDTLHVGNYTSALEGEEILISADPASIRAVSESGADVTSSYQFVPVPKRMEDVVRVIDVSTPSLTVQYDGLPHGLSEGVSVSGLAEGHAAHYTLPARTEAGAEENAFTSFSVTDEAGEDVTRHYYLRYASAGLLTVTRRKVTVCTQSSSSVYDGKAHTYSEYTLPEQGLAAGQTLRLEGVLTLTEAGASQNAPSLFVMEGERDVTHNYELTPVWGLVEITPRPVTLSTSPLVLPYDGKPHPFPAPSVTEGEPAAGQTFLFSPAGSAEDAGVYENRPSYSVVDESGLPVSLTNYAVTESFGTVEIEALKISLSTVGETRPYDGKAHVYNDLAVAGALAEGQRVERTDVVTAEEVGVYPNTPVYVITDGAREILLRNYQITESFGTVEIETLKISLSTVGETRPYDGRDHVYNDLTVNGALADGQRVERTDEVRAQNVGTYPNTPAYHITDGDREIPLRNYEITESFGTVEIEALKISLSTTGEDRPYDGKEHVYSDLTVNGALADGQRVERTDEVRAENVGTYPNTPAYRITDGDREIPLRNYEITESFGRVEISPLSVTLVTESARFVYDGREHAYSDLTWRGTPAAGEGFRRTSVLTARDAGEYPNRPEYVIEDESGRIIPAQNYMITEEFGRVEISPRPVTLVTESAEWTYDGQERSYSDLSCAADTPLAGGERLVRTSVLAARDAGEYPNRPEYVIEGEGGRQIPAQNYTVAEQFGTVTVLVRPISVRAAGGELVYDGNEHLFAEVTFLGDTSLAEGQTYSVLDPLRVKNVGVYPNEPELAVWAGGELVTKNYQIRTEGNTVAVTPRTLKVKTASETYYYDGTTHTYGAETVEITEGSLGAGDFLFVPSPLQTRDADEDGYPNRAEVLLQSGEGDASGNYTFTVEYGVVRVLRRTLRVQTETVSFVYNGAPQGSDGAFVAEGSGEGYGLAAGHALSTRGGTRRTEAGEEPNILSVSVLGGAGEDVTENYIIADLSYGLLTVTRRPVTFATGSMSWEYDGTPHEYGEVYPLGGDGLAEGHTYTCAVGSLPSITDCGERANSFAYTARIWDGGGAEVTSNYEISYSEEWGVITVTELGVRLKTLAGSWEYDGKPHSAEGYTVVSGSLAAGHTLRATYLQIEVVGKTPNLPFGGIIVDGEGNNVTGNYTLTWEYGILEITPRKVTLRTASAADVVYDGAFHAAEGVGAADGKDLVEGHVVLLTYRRERDAGEYQNIPNLTAEGTVGDGWQIVDGAGADMTSNYEITWEFGSFSILRRPVSLSTGSAEAMYDALPHSAPSWSYREEDYGAGTAFYRLAEGQELVIGEGDYPFLIEAGEASNMPQAYAVTEGGAPVSLSNYDFRWTCGSLKVTLRPLTVRTEDVGWIYDGTSHTAESAVSVSYPAGGLGHTVTPAFKEQTEVGDYDNECTVTVADEYGNPVTRNYEISYLFSGTVTVTARPVAVQTGSATWVYAEGGSYSTAAYEAERGLEGRGFLASHSPVFTPTVLTAVTDSAVEVRTVQNLWSAVRVLDGLGVDRTADYEISFTYGALRVKAPVVVSLYTITEEYDGKPHTFEEGDYTVESLPPDVTEAQVRVTLGGSLTEPGSLTLNEVYEASVAFVEAAEGEVNRVDFTGSATPLTVTRRTIKIRTATIVADRGEEPLYGSDAKTEAFGIFYNSLADGHVFADSVCVTGVLQPDEDRAENTLSEVVILDAEGNDVTRFYNIILECGTLSWSEE